MVERDGILRFRQLPCAVDNVAAGRPVPRYVPVLAECSAFDPASLVAWTLLRRGSRLKNPIRERRALPDAQKAGEESPMNRLVLAVATVFALGATAAAAHDYKIGALEIGNPWSRAVPKGGQVAAGYLTIKNTGTAPDRLVGGTSSAAGKVEVHEMSMDKGVMKMRPVSGGLEIKPGETVELKPGSSFHIMMTGLKSPIERGKPFKASLTFEKAGPVEVEFTVVAAGASAPAAAPAGTMPAGMPGMPGMPGMHH
jgi:periplasmic copper chaperone A